MVGVEGVALKRAVPRWQVLGLAVNDVVGSGVYLLPAAATLLLGAWSLGAVALAALAVLLIVLCFAEAGSRFDEPGGGYLYARMAFGDLVGFEVGWMTWLARVASVASLSAGFAQALSYLMPEVASGVPRQLTIVSLFVVLTAINVGGVVAGARTAVGLAIAKLLPLVLFVVAGAFAFSWTTLESQPMPERFGLGEAALLLLFAYAGFENTPAPAGEYKRPQRDVPFALLGNLALVTVLYFSVQAIALGTLPGLATSDTPLADASEGFLGPWAGFVLTVGAAVSILGTSSATTLSGPRYLFAIARDGFGPRFLAKVHPRFRTPANAILFQSAVALPLALTGSFVGLAALSVIARLATYIGTAAAVPVLRKRGDLPPASFVLPGGPTIPILACLVSAALAASAGPRNLVAGAIALVVGLGIYALRRRPA
ncbi:MAG TPA: amino acid permease [Thermoanaerobaculia bacterium]|nr:amino acid permease [Thermoanaerobaculia bacterium]